MIYLDCAATTLQKPPAVAEASMRAIRTMSSPGRGGHSAAMLAADTAFSCRELAAGLLGVESPESIVFTLNATHALNIAIKSLVHPGSRVLISSYEHNSVLRPLYAMGARITVAVSELFNPEDTVRSFEERIRNSDLVVVNHTSNVFGYILPVEEISSMCKKAGVPLIVDVSQSAGILKINYSKLGADFIGMPGHKGLYGPQGTGILVAKYGKTLLEGGTGSNSKLPEMPDFMPDRLEAGTHNMPGIAGLAEGIKFVTSMGTDRVLSHGRELIRVAGDGLEQIKGVKVFRAKNPENQLGVMSFNIRDIPSEQVATELSERNIAVRAGMHCAPLAHRAAGTYEQGTVRVSVSAFNTKNEMYKLIQAVSDISKKV